MRTPHGCARITLTLLSLFSIHTTLLSQGLVRAWWEEHEEFFDAGNSSLDRLFAARYLDLDRPKKGASPYRVEVAFYRETRPMRSGLDKLDWSRASMQMKRLSKAPPKGLLHHQRLRILEGQKAIFGDLSMKDFFIDTNVEVSTAALYGNSPVIRSLREGLSLCLRLQPGKEGLPRRIELDLAWQKFPDKVQKMKVGLDQLPSLDEFRSDFFRVQGNLSLGKQQAWLYCPGGSQLPKLAILILVEGLVPPKARSHPTTPPRDPKPAWMVQIGKEQWTAKRAWTPVAAPLSIPALGGLPIAIQGGSSRSYMADINIEIGLNQVIVDPEISMFLSGLRAGLVIQTLGDRLWVQLMLRDRALDSMRDVPLQTTLHGTLKAPVFRSRFLRRDFLLEPGERLPLGSGVGVRIGDKIQRTRLWLQIDPLPKPH